MSFITTLIEQHPHELMTDVSPQKIAKVLHNSLMGNALYPLSTGITKQESDDELHRIAGTTVDIILSSQLKAENRPSRGAK